jgi:H+-transporting ATPase
MTESTLITDADTAAKLSTEELLRKLRSDPAGLTEEDAAQRLEQVGPNAIPEKHEPLWLKFLRYFWGPIPWMIEAAAILSGVVRHWADLVIIGVLLCVNAVIGFWQEHKADNAIALLKQKLALEARVRRAGKWTTRPARDLVPGDLVRIRLGDVVPADMKLMKADNLSIDQSALTGESLPVGKEASDLAYSGSVVQRGEADGIVTATGLHTFFGKTASLVQQAKATSHYQKAVMRIGHFLIMVTIALVAVILITALFRHTPFLETLQFTLILTVASIPVALPAVLSVTMAVGAVKLAKRQAIVSRLVSIEEMAGMDVLCSDKTGTLTQNRLTLGEPVRFTDEPADELIRAAALASREEDHDPIEAPIFQGLQDKSRALSGCKVEAFEPFDPVSKRSEATIAEKGRRFRVTKGAPQVIADLCDADAALREKVENAANDLAGRGYRTLGVARATDEGPWRLLGLLPLFDPPRDDSAETIQAARGMGIDVKMVTGDHLAIAEETARRLELGQDIISAEDAFSSGHAVSDERIAGADGFAQVFPEHKYKIVEALQRLGHFVGMTGDGVNDAPALKKADAGVAVSGATDAARGAADLVLTAPGLSVIIDAIKESRRIFRRMNSYAIYRIAETTRVLLFMTAAILIFNFYPVTAVMIIILALVNDGPIMLIAYDRTPLLPSPTRWDMHKVLTIAFVLGVLGVFASFTWFWIGESVLHLDRATIQTLMFLKLSVAGHLTIYLARTGEHHFWERPLPAPILFFTAESLQLTATLVAVYGLFMEPVGWKLAGLTWAYALAWFIVTGFVKVHAFRLVNHHERWGRRSVERGETVLHHGATLNVPQRPSVSAK